VPHCQAVNTCNNNRVANSEDAFLVCLAIEA